MQTGVYEPVCRRHPTYKGTRAPRSECVACWQKWHWKESRKWRAYLADIGNTVFKLIVKERNAGS